MAELDAYCALHPNDNLDFGSWAAKELAYLKAVESEPKQDALVRVMYVEELDKLARLKYNIVRSALVIPLIFYRNALQLSRDDNFLSYNQLSFMPGSGLSHMASTATKQSHAA